MLIKKSWLLMGIVAVTLGSALTFSGCIQQEKAIGDDYLLFQRSEMDKEYLHIAKNGYAEHTMYHSSSRKVNTHIVSGWKITAHNSGTLSEGDMRQLSEFIENSGFFKLAGSYPRIIRPFYGNPEYFAISVRKEGKVKSVYVYNGTPAPFNEVRDYLREKVKAQLQNDPRYGTFIMAERVKGSTSENNLSEEDLKAHPFLAQAIRNPEWFIYIGSLENTRIEDYNPRGRNDIFVTFEDNNYHVRVIERAE